MSDQSELTQAEAANTDRKQDGTITKKVVQLKANSYLIILISDLLLKRIENRIKLNHQRNLLSLLTLCQGCR